METNSRYESMHTNRHGSVGNIETVEKLKLIHSFILPPMKDQSRLLESYRNSASAIMIRATPNSVRWDEVNQIKYRFQALNFHVESIDSMMQNSPPLIRRERAQTSPVKKLQIRTSGGGGDEPNEKIPNNNFLTTIRRSSSFDSINKNAAKRKISVVQISKDDTSDYNSDEDVFSDGRNTTVYHIENSQIRDRTQIRITRSPSLEGAAGRNSDYYVTSETYLHDDETLMSLTREDLVLKSKRELIEIVRQLQSKVQPSQNNEASEQSSQNNEASEQSEVIEQKSVSSLVKEFEEHMDLVDSAMLPTQQISTNNQVHNSRKVIAGNEGEDDLGE